MDDVPGWSWLKERCPEAVWIYPSEASLVFSLFKPSTFMNMILAEYEMLISHSAGDAEETVRYTGLEFKEEVRSTDMK